MGRPIDLTQIRDTIAAAKAGGRATFVSVDWLEGIERELLAGRAAQAQLAGQELTARVIETIEHRPAGGVIETIERIAR